ncbi:efflux RND transporter periplasmic adaptor subunit [Aliarcobacter lanthieri]|uniref:efflux RND transporter periplasmic adaptor subunit n=1 Tax=Aliarcobacter lanthieri TaxID=1355374 RepID=UPI00047C35EE|nr:efflux RND transporter periplasmic adaptor subunit [Aliarcobacter lanthieri]QKF59521.1 RND family efflux system, membrane fusion protein [Aliarcobacter lanthieri]
MKKLLTLFILATNLFANSLELDGIVQSQNEKVISSKMMGYITKIYVNEGDSVNKGQLLYEIDPTDIIHNSDILKNQVQNLELNLKRYKDLLNQDLVSKFEYEQLELNLITAKAKLSELNANFNYLKVKATNNALVIKKSIKEGEMAMPGMPHLILTDLDDLIIKSNIAESNLKNIKINQEVNIEIPSQEFKAKGKIVAIFPNIASNTHSFSIKISFDKKDFQIYPNMYAKISINLDK